MKSWAAAAHAFRRVQAARAPPYRLPRAGARVLLFDELRSAELLRQAALAEAVLTPS